MRAQARICEGCRKPGGTPVEGKWYLHPQCSKPFREGIARGGAIALRERDELREALGEMLKAFEALMPGLRHISVPSYTLINDAPLRARRLLHAHVSDRAGDRRSSGVRPPGTTGRPARS